MTVNFSNTEIEFSYVNVLIQFARVPERKLANFIGGSGKALFFNIKFNFSCHSSCTGNTPVNLNTLFYLSGEYDVHFKSCSYRDMLFDIFIINILLL